MRRSSTPAIVVENLFWLAAKNKMWRTGCLFAAALSLVACGTFTEKVVSHGDFQRQVVTGKGFKHVVYLNRAVADSDTLHVYIEGDGVPFVNQGRMVAVDPTSVRPLMLELMLKDDTQSIYLGRPCYNGLVEENGCKPWFWTHGRYSEEVVSSMVAAVERLKQQLNATKIVLMGHSGGGSLVVLMAPHIADAKGVVTLAGNLNIDSWADQHGYTPLTGSLNPATRELLPETVRQYHYLGSADRVIKEQDVRAFVERQVNASYHQLDGVDHTCCWNKYWGNILSTLKTYESTIK